MDFTGHCFRQPAIPELYVSGVANTALLGSRCCRSDAGSQNDGGKNIPITAGEINGAFAMR
jgi:hypothetical protein